MEVCNVLLNTFCKEFYTCHVKCNIAKKLSFLGLKFGIGKPLQSINYKLSNHSCFSLCFLHEIFYNIQKELAKSF